MSYCRWSECDFYIYDDISGGITIHMIGGETVNFGERSDALAYIYQQKNKGNKIPDRVISCIKEELKEFGESGGLEPMEDFL